MNILDTDKIDMGDLAKQILQAIYRSNAIRALSEKIEDALKFAVLKQNPDGTYEVHSEVLEVREDKVVRRSFQGDGKTIYEAMTACARELNLYYYGPDSENVAGITERVAATKGQN